MVYLLILAMHVLPEVNPKLVSERQEVVENVVISKSKKPLSQLLQRSMNILEAIKTMMLIILSGFFKILKRTQPYWNTTEMGEIKNCQTETSIPSFANSELEKTFWHSFSMKSRKSSL